MTPVWCPAVSANVELFIRSRVTPYVNLDTHTWKLLHENVYVYIYSDVIHLFTRFIQTTYKNDHKQQDNPKNIVGSQNMKHASWKANTFPEQKVKRTCNSFESSHLAWTDSIMYNLVISVKQWYQLFKVFNFKQNFNTSMGLTDCTGMFNRKTSQESSQCRPRQEHINYCRQLITSS